MQHEHHRVPVTALAFWNDEVILAGEGDHIKAYNLHDHSLLWKFQAFEGQSVHGNIVDEQPGHSLVLAWGNRCLRTFSLQDSTNGRPDLTESKVIEAEDWILDAAFAPENETSSTRVALVTAHNALATCDIATGSLSPKLTPLVPGSNCILYCANLDWRSKSHCVVASGTAFGDIIVWSCQIDERGGKVSATPQTHYVFSAHQGSVFGVTISSRDVASAMGKRECVLASCSDDRTIKVWDISDLTRKSPSLLEIQRQTGFSADVKQETSGPPCLATTMGHISRIWHVRFSLSVRAESDSKTVSIVSFGEDASCITWSVEQKSSGTDMPYALKQQTSSKAHSGKNIWAVAQSPLGRTATGGADGAIALHQRTDGENADATPSEIDQALLGKDADNYKTYRFIGPNELFTTTDSGRTALLSLEGTPRLANRTPTETAFPGLRGYSVLAMILGQAFFAGNDGMVYSYSRDSGRIETVLQSPRKVAALFACSLKDPQHNNGPGITVVLATNVGSSTALLVHIQERQDVTDDEPRLVTKVEELPLPANFIVTSFTTFSLDRTVFVFGSRTGSIALYHFSHEHWLRPDAEPSIHHKVHGKEAVTSLTWHAENETGVLFSTGRDGTCAAHHLTSTNNQYTLHTAHQLSLPFGPNIEGVSIRPDGHLWVWGFRSKQFVVYDQTLQRDIMDVECGGAHRNWSYQPEQNGGLFAWTKASKLMFARQSHRPFRLVNGGGHGREIKASCLSPMIGPLQILATGAEDTDIKLNVYRNRQFQCLQTLQKHVTGIQHLQWSSNGRYLFSSGGFEEFYIWRMTPNVPILGLGVICESKHPNSGTSDLRITSFSVQEKSPEAEGGEGGFTITMAYSNSDIKVWRYHQHSRQWSCLASGTYLASCLTQCVHLPQDGQLVTASTDGHIAFWAQDPSQSTLQWSSRHKIHQSSILSLQTHPLSDGSTLVLSGGDDNALGITRILSASSPTLPSAAEGTAPSSVVLTRAHAAAITAVEILSSTFSASSSIDTICFITAGLDQRVKLWEVRLNLTLPDSDFVVEVRKIEDRFTPVADVSGVNLMRVPSSTVASVEAGDIKASAERDGIQKEGNDVGIWLCGVGMDIRRISSSSLLPGSSSE